MNYMRAWLAVIPLFILLALAFWFAGTSWMHFDSGEIPFTGWLAIAGGAGMSLLVGGGLMALVFYSSRRGYDDRVGRDPAEDGKPTESTRKRTDPA